VIDLRPLPWQVLLEPLDAGDEARVLRPPAEILAAQEADGRHAELGIGIGVSVCGAVLGLDGVEKVADLVHRVARDAQSGEVAALERLQAPAGDGRVTRVARPVAEAAE